MKEENFQKIIDSYQHWVREDMKTTLKRIEEDGFTDDNMAYLRSLADRIDRLEAANTFNFVWGRR
jgi:hypothetical protein